MSEAIDLRNRFRALIKPVGKIRIERAALEVPASLSTLQKFLSGQTAELRPMYHNALVAWVSKAEQEPK